MKVLDVRLRIDFRALVMTYLRMILQPATLSRKQAWSQSSEGAKGRVKA